MSILIGVHHELSHNRFLRTMIYICDTDVYILGKVLCIYDREVYIYDWDECKR